MLISTKEYAEKCGVTQKSVYICIYSKKLRTACKVEGEWMIDENEPYPERRTRKLEVEWLPPPSDGYITMIEYAKQCGVPAEFARQAAQRGEISGAIRLNKYWVVGTGDIPVSATEYARLHNMAKSAVLDYVKNGKLPGYKIGEGWYVVSPEDSKKILVNQPRDRNKNLVGQTFGYLTVLEELGHDRLRCECRCKRIVEVWKSAVVAGNTRSCGCLRNEAKSKGLNSIYFQDGRYMYKRNINGKYIYFGSFPTLEAAQAVNNRVNQILYEYGSTPKAYELCLQIKQQNVKSVVRNVLEIGGEKRIIIDKVDFQKVKQLFLSTQNLSIVSKEFHITPGKVKKILATCGTYANDKQREVVMLHQSGKSQEEIARICGLSIKVVQDCLPYDKGPLISWEIKAPRTDRAMQIMREKTNGIPLTKELGIIAPEEVKSLRKALKMNTAQFSRLIGVEYYVISHWEKGKAKPAKKNLYKLLEIKRVLDQGGSPQAAIDRCLQIKEAVGRKAEDKRLLSPKSIKKIRNSLNLSIEKFAELLGVNQITIRYWEEGRTFPQKGNLDKLLKLKQEGNNADPV